MSNRQIAWLVLLAISASSSLLGQSWRPPAGTRPALRRPGAESILPGGRMIAPLGRQFSTGPGPWGLAISPNGKTVVTSDSGPNKYSLSVLLSEKEGWRGVTHTAIKRGEKEKEADDDFYSVFMGLTFDDDKELFASEGNSGNVRMLNAQNGHTKHVFKLNANNYRDSYSGDVVMIGRAAFCMLWIRQISAWLRLTSRSAASCRVRAWGGCLSPSACHQTINMCG